MKKIKIREYERNDCIQIVKLFCDTIRFINSKDYSKEEVDAWITGNTNVDKWNKSFENHYCLIAEKGNIIVGFGDMYGNYIDRLYVHKDYQNIKIGSMILYGLENYASEHMETIISVHASVTAKPFFEKRGYKEICKRQVKRNGVFLVNFAMEKDMGINFL